MRVLTSCCTYELQGFAMYAGSKQSMLSHSCCSLQLLYASHTQQSDFDEEHAVLLNAGEDACMWVS